MIDLEQITLEECEKSYLNKRYTYTLHNGHVIRKNDRLTCKVCNCYCDPSDLKNGVCDDCRDKLAP